MSTKERRQESLGALHDLLLRACPPVNGERSIPILANQLDMSAQALYYWIKQDKISPKLAKAITDLKGCGASLEEFQPFVFR